MHHSAVPCMSHISCIYLKCQTDSGGGLASAEFLSFAVFLEQLLSERQTPVM